MRKLKQPLIWLVAALFVGLNVLVLGRLLDLGPAAPAATGVPAAADARPVVRVGVISRYAPTLIYDAYQPVMDYLSAAGAHRYELKLSASYEDAAEQLRRGEVSASFFGAWIYARLGPSLGLAPVLAPRGEDGGASSRAVLIAAAASPLRSVADLAGRRVALPSRDSYAAHWFAATCLGAAGLAAADLDSVHHFGYHQTVVYRVLDGRFDAGVVKESVAREFGGQAIRVVARSGPYPGPPLVIRAGDRSPALAEMVELLLTLDPADARDAAVLRGWDNEFSRGFVAVDARTYEPVVRLLDEGGGP
ncbi:MAG: PhnD/SsuA/transferrin family substrate-binding protein [bacterium]|nr:PhnD/SsuA/transferrin family substrate-binding protein [bacterium]